MKLDEKLKQFVVKVSAPGIIMESILWSPREVGESPQQNTQQIREMCVCVCVCLWCLWHRMASYGIVCDNSALED